MGKKTTRFLMIAVGIGLVAVALGFLITSSVPARADDDNEHRRRQELEPQVASDTITLQAAGPACGPFGFAFNRSVVKSGGNAEFFTLPAGKVLVVTSLDWLDSGNSGVANLARTVFLYRFNFGGVNGASAQSTAVADSTGRAGGSETFPTGLVLRNPGQLCIGLDPTGPQLVPGESLTATVNGFLAADQ